MQSAFGYSESLVNWAKNNVGASCGNNGGYIVVECSCHSNDNNWHDMYAQDCGSSTPGYSCTFGSYNRTVGVDTYVSWLECVPYSTITSVEFGACNSTVCGCDNLDNPSFGSPDANGVSVATTSHTWSDTSCMYYDNNYIPFAYGCGADYYRVSGSGSNIKCARCPAITSVAGTQVGTISENGHTMSSITDCYIPKMPSSTRFPNRYTFSDTSGTYYYAADCAYSL